MSRSLSFLAMLFGAGVVCDGAELVIEVRGARGSGIDDAVVYATPEGSRPSHRVREAVMDQRDRMFVPHVLPVQTGTAVSFPNSDDVRHQVYSFSPAKKFQLPLYEGTPPAPVVFDQPGVVALGCNIHDRMSAYIVVVGTPYFAVTVDGSAELPGLPAGRYTVRAWYPRIKGQAPLQSLTLEAGERRRIELSTARR